MSATLRMLCCGIVSRATLIPTIPYGNASTTQIMLLDSTWPPVASMTDQLRRTQGTHGLPTHHVLAKNMLAVCGTVP